MALELRSAPLEVRGRRISGVAILWGQRAAVPEHGEEVFTSGAFGDDAGLKPVSLTLEHGGAEIGEVQPANSERGLEVEGEYSGDLEGRDRFSIEFRARKDTRSQGLRIVHSAQLVGLASVRRPAYEGAEIEARQGASLTLLEGPPGAGKSQELDRLVGAENGRHDFGARSSREVARHRRRGGRVFRAPDHRARGIGRYSPTH